VQLSHLPLRHHFSTNHPAIFNQCSRGGRQGAVCLELTPTLVELALMLVDLTPALVQLAQVLVELLLTRPQLSTS
jgi:hypothetical protein